MSVTDSTERWPDSSKASSPEIFELGELTVRIEPEVGEWIVSVYGELDLSSADLFDCEINRAIDEAQNVVLDLSGLHFVDSTGVRSLVAATRLAAARSRGLGVLRPPHDVQRILELTGVVDMVVFLD